MLQWSLFSSSIHIELGQLPFNLVYLKASLALIFKLSNLRKKGKYYLISCDTEFSPLYFFANRHPMTLCTPSSSKQLLSSQWQIWLDLQRSVRLFLWPSSESHIQIAHTSNCLCWASWHFCELLFMLWIWFFVKTLTPANGFVTNPL